MPDSPFITPPPSRARGMFEIFATGLFVVVHLGMFLWVLEVREEAEAVQQTEGVVVDRDVEGAQKSKQKWDSPVALFIAAIVATFSFLIGTLLRMIRCDFADTCSGRYRRAERWIKWQFGRLIGNARGRKLLEHPSWDTEAFPYIGFLGEQCQRLPDSAQDFYRHTWQEQDLGETTYFNFCKAVLTKIDPASAAEAFAAEALSRYVAQMLYALCLAVAIVIAVLCLGNVDPYRGVAWLLLGAYLVMITVILRNYRFLRTKEVGIVFAMCFANMQELKKLGVVPDGSASPMDPLGGFYFGVSRLTSIEP